MAGHGALVLHPLGGQVQAGAALELVAQLGGILVLGQTGGKGGDRLAQGAEKGADQVRLPFDIPPGDAAGGHVSLQLSHGEIGDGFPHPGEPLLLGEGELIGETADDLLLGQQALPHGLCQERFLELLMNERQGPVKIAELLALTDILWQGQIGVGEGVILVHKGLLINKNLFFVRFFPAFPGKCEEIAGNTLFFPSMDRGKYGFWGRKPRPSRVL